MDQIYGGPAPALTKIKFVAIRGDKESDWQNITGESAKGPCIGQRLCMAIDFIGYPNTGTVRFYLNGSVIDLSQVTYEMNLRKPLVDAGYVYGFREYYQIPFSVIGNHPAIRVEASGRNGGKAYAILSNLQLIAK